MKCCSVSSAAATRVIRRLLMTCREVAKTKMEEPKPWRTWYGPRPATS
jgi:hypothetical protein